jgi:predicted metal-dependent hydrolase
MGVTTPTAKSGVAAVSISCRMKLDTIRVFAISKLSWIKHQQKKIRGQERETPREYLDRESHYQWGRRYLLKVVEEQRAPSVELKHSKLILRVGPGANDEAKRAVLALWYREQIRVAAPDLIAKWEPDVGVQVRRVFVQKMKTKWGSCNSRKRSIRLNTDLAKKPRECIEYIVVHEMVHMVEPTHNSRFIALTDRLMPQWRSCREQLNELPVSQEKWTY